MRKVIIITWLIVSILTPSLLIAVETAPRISDREIVERLARLEEGQKNIEMRFDDVNSRFDTMQWQMHRRLVGGTGVTCF